MTDKGSDDVLVVEDDAELNDLVGAYARLAGFGYRAAHTGNEALQEVEHSFPALIVLDLMLPDLDGLEVCRRLKSNIRTGSIPVVILTALDGADTRERCVRCGAAKFLTKPFDPDYLMQVIRDFARH